MTANRITRTGIVELSRRGFVMATGTLAGVGAGLWLVPRTARAHHGWSSFDESKPLYLSGTVKTVRWQNPHAEITLTLPAKREVPGDLASRKAPPQTNPVDGAMVLAKAAAPAHPGADWVVELAPLFRMEAWGVKPLAVGQKIAAVGYAFPDQKQPLIRCEYLIVGADMYGLRSMPAK
jgi:hypothetical protein